MITPLINIQAVSDSADLSSNISERKYNQYIIDAQNRFLSELIGIDCLDGLVDRTCSNTLTADDFSLMDHITPYLVAYSYALYVGSSMKISLNTGVASLTGDNASVLDQQSRVNETKKYLLSGEFYGRKIVKHLIDNPTLYPCYDSKLCKITSDYSIVFGL